MPFENRRVIFAERPDGHPTADTFAHDSEAVGEIAQGEYLLRISLLSMDPALVGRMRAESNYAESVEEGAVMHAYGIGQVVESKNSDVKPGEVRMGRLDMQEYAVFRDSAETSVINLGLTSEENYLSVVGITGATAYFSLLDIGKPKAGETILISAGASSVASVVAQMTKRMGLRTVGIVSTDEKAQRAKDDWNYNAVISYRGKSIAELSAEVKKACPDGVDIYYDNTSGDISEAVLDSFNDYARHIVIGRLAISHLANTRDDIGRRDNNDILAKRLTKQGFVLTDYQPVFRAAFLQLAKWVNQGQIKAKCDVLRGIDNTVPAFFRMLNGENQGKQLVRLAPIDDSADPTPRRIPKLLTSRHFPTGWLVNRIKLDFIPKAL